MMKKMLQAWITIFKDTFTIKQDTTVPALQAQLCTY